MKRIMLAVVSLAALLAVPVFAGIAQGSTDATSVAHVAVGKSGNVYSPAKLKVAVGTKVVWKNDSTTGVSHTVTAYGGNWSKSVVLAPGQTTSFTFNKKGTYKYHCKFHSTLSKGVCSFMCGVIVVG
jgi:plastocyanin